MRLLAFFTFPIALVFAQSGPGFEVATVKPHDPQSPITIASGYSPLRFYATGTVRDLLRLAYGVQDAQISGGPNWVNSERFDIEGRPGQPSNPDQLKTMLQSLLAGRFHLELRHESRELPVYELVVAKSGPKLPAAVDGSTGITTGATRINGQFPLGDLARYLSQNLGRMVLDRTGLEGAFQIKLEWKPDEESVFTAIQEQLGLRLESTKAAVDVLMIDHAERPSEN
jgi:uncharacterized protein (TIGR03435 family)